MERSEIEGITAKDRGSVRELSQKRRGMEKDRGHCQIWSKQRNVKAWRQTLAKTTPDRVQR